MHRPSYTFDAGAATHPGKVRDRNEDALLLRADIGLWAVADGMGGHDAGDLASKLVIEALAGISRAESAVSLLEEAETKVLLANQEIIDLGRRRGGGPIGSTVIILLIYEDHYACLWAGDSRLYLVSDIGVTRLSRDHTEAEEMIARGALTSDEAKHWPQNVITRAIGVHENVELDMTTGGFDEANTFVLCSDGLNKHVSDEEIRQYVTTSSAQASCDALIELALSRGGHDNVTVVVVKQIRQTMFGETTTAPASAGQPGDVWE